MKAILTYHSIDDSGSMISVGESAFREHVAWLTSGAVRVVALRDLASIEGDADAVAITFDDALENYGERAAPILIEAGVPSTTFVVSGLVGGAGEWSGGLGGVPAFPLLGWDALAALAESGLVEIGAHTRSHPMLPCASDDVLTDEVEGCASDIRRHTGLQPESFAYPYGAFDARAVRAASGAFARSVTTTLGFVPPDSDAHRLPRLDMYYFREPGSLRSWGTARFRAKVTSRRMARALKRALKGSPC